MIGTGSSRCDEHDRASTVRAISRGEIAPQVRDVVQRCDARLQDPQQDVGAGIEVAGAGHGAADALTPSTGSASATWRDTPWLDARRGAPLDRLRRHAVLVPDPSVVPTDESGRRLETASIRR
jgi:hypothetical protein